MPIAEKCQDAAKTGPDGGLDPARSEELEDELSSMQASSERLLLATMQCSLSLIGFGFTIYQIFSDVAAKTGLARANTMANRVGICLLGLGLILLAGGLWNNARASRLLNARRARLVARGLMAPRRRRAVSPVFAVASLLLLQTLTILGVIAARLLG